MICRVQGEGEGRGLVEIVQTRSMHLIVVVMYDIGTLFDIDRHIFVH